MTENYGFEPVGPDALPPDEVEALDRLARDLSGRLGGEWAVTAWRRDRPPPSYTINPDGTTITCHRCGRTSHHPSDVFHRYCGMCKRFHADAAE